MKSLRLTVACAALITISACGGGSSDADAKAAIKTELLKTANTLPDGAFGDKEATCASSKIVDGIGVDQLKKYGLLTSDGKVKEQVDTVTMEGKDADVMASAVVDCVDFDKLVSSVSGAASGPVGDCLSKALDADAFKQLLSAQFQGKTPDQSALTAAISKCATG